MSKLKHDRSGIGSREAIIITLQNKDIFRESGQFVKDKPSLETNRRHTIIVNED